MNVKASARSTVILAAGLWLCISTPLQAAEGTEGGASAATARVGAPVVLNKFARHRHPAKAASWHRKSVKSASRPAGETAKRAEKTKAVEASSSRDDDAQFALSPSIANAHAQLAAAD